MLEARVGYPGGVQFYAVTHAELDAQIAAWRNDMRVKEITVYSDDGLVYDAYRWRDKWETYFQAPTDWAAVDDLPDPRPELEG